jgi:antitoxin (DNA-binding transcriptional repressor) of toxin-antitoxin stability system
MVRANIAEFKARISYFVKLLKRGERVVLCERNIPIATLVPEPEAPSMGKRILGQHRGKFSVPNEAWRALTDEELKEYFGDALA